MHNNQEEKQQVQDLAEYTEQDEEPRTQHCEISLEVSVLGRQSKSMGCICNVRVNCFVKLVPSVSDV